MAELLHVVASPRNERSHSRKVADIFIESYVLKHPGDSVRTLNLWESDIPGFDRFMINAKYKIMHGQDHAPEEAAAWRKITGIFEQFAGADKYLFSVPMWNFSIPYKLKQWIDVICQPGLAFSFSPDTGYSGLVTGKPAAVIFSSGGAYGNPPFAAMDFAKPYFRAFLRFAGFENISEIAVEPTMMGSREEIEKMLLSKKEEAGNLAKDF